MSSDFMRNIGTQFYCSLYFCKSVFLLRNSVAGFKKQNLGKVMSDCWKDRKSATFLQGLPPKGHSLTHPSYKQLHAASKVVSLPVCAPLWSLAEVRKIPPPAFSRTRRGGDCPQPTVCVRKQQDNFGVFWAPPTCCMSHCPPSPLGAGREKKNEWWPLKEHSEIRAKVDVSKNSLLSCHGTRSVLLKSIPNDTVLHNLGVRGFFWHGFFFFSKELREGSRDQRRKKYLRQSYQGNKMDFWTVLPINWLPTCVHILVH